jgi:2-keto-4-pentenoate hydratase/2-oxohepta-3-ene-1,7-dioic acid hydratase in catechol pathway
VTYSPLKEEIVWRPKDAIARYFLSNDVSERVFQIERSGGQWNKGKGCETFGPIGPWFVTRDEVKDPQNLNMWLDVNGEIARARQYEDHDLRL